MKIICRRLKYLEGSIVSVRVSLLSRCTEIKLHFLMISYFKKKKKKKKIYLKKKKKNL
jgi:hypothetical protein